MKIAGLRGPISIQASEQDLVINPPTDRERYATAPLSTGQFVRVKDLVIFAETVGVDKASFRVFTNSEFAIKQSADTKAAARLASLKKTTITCIKGKVTRKVTAIKPKCPAGYKKK